MGSFIVTVIGKNPEQQILKYSSVHTPELPNPYMILKDITQELNNSMPANFEGSLSDFLLEECASMCINELKFSQEIDTYGKHYNGYYTLDEVGQVQKVISRQNNLAECDGFTLGGGWAGFYYIKEGHSGIQLGIPRKGTVVRPNTADMILKGDIDFDRTFKEAGDYAAQHYDAFHALRVKHDNCLDEKFHEEFWEGQNKGTFPIYASIYDYEADRELFVRLRQLYSIASYAFIINGEINKKPHCIGPLPIDDELAWLESIWKTMSALPDDTVFALYQCHE